MDNEAWLKSIDVLRNWKNGFSSASLPDSLEFKSQQVKSSRQGGSSLWAEYREPYEGIRLICFELDPTLVTPRVMCRVWFYEEQADLEDKYLKSSLPKLLDTNVIRWTNRLPQPSWKSELTKLGVMVKGIQYDVELPDVFGSPKLGTEGLAGERISAGITRIAQEFLSWADRTFRTAGSSVDPVGHSNQTVDTGKVPNKSGTQNREGSSYQVLQTVYERNGENRSICISHYGHSCQACDMDFESFYGEMGKEFIHVHHESPLHSLGEAQYVDPIKDMKPLCPNCHAMVHRTEQPMPVALLSAQT